MHRIRVELEDGVAVVSASGDLDAYASPELSEAFASTVEDGRTLLVADLSRVSFMDSTTLSLVVRAVRELSERGGQARVVLPRGTARRIFEITTLDRVLPVSRSRAHACAELAGWDNSEQS